MLKQLIYEQIQNILSENTEHKQTIEYHDEMADEHNEAWQRADRALQNPNLSNDKYDRMKKARDAHVEGYMHHISAKKAWQKGNVEKGKELSARADQFDHHHIGKGTFI